MRILAQISKLHRFILLNNTTKAERRIVPPQLNFYLQTSKFSVLARILTVTYLPNLFGIPSQPPGIVALVFSPPQAQQ